MIEVRFELTPPKRSGPKPDALDHSATQPPDIANDNQGLVVVMRYNNINQRFLSLKAVGETSWHNG